MSYYTLSGGAEDSAPLPVKGLNLKVNEVELDRGLELCSGSLANEPNGVPIRAELGTASGKDQGGPEVWLDYSDGARSLAFQRISPKYDLEFCESSCIVDFPMSEIQQERASRRDLEAVVTGAHVNSFGNAIVTLRSSSLSLRYHSGGFSEPSVGLGWGWNLAGFYAWLESDPVTGDLTFHDGRGSFDRWAYRDGSYRSCCTNDHNQASCNESGYQLTTRDDRTLSFRPDGKLVREVNGQGISRSYAYDQSGWLLRVQSDDGHSFHLDYGDRADGQPVSVREESASFGPQTNFEYDSNGRLSKLTSPSGEANFFRYTADQRLSKVINGRGQTVVDFRYLHSGPHAGRVCSEIHSGHTMIHYTYAGRSAGVSIEAFTLGCREDAHYF